MQTKALRTAAQCFERSAAWQQVWKEKELQKLEGAGRGRDGSAKGSELEGDSHTKYYDTY